MNIIPSMLCAGFGAIFGLILLRITPPGGRLLWWKESESDKAGFLLVTMVIDATCDAMYQLPFAVGLIHFAPLLSEWMSRRAKKTQDPS